VGVHGVQCSLECLREVLSKIVKQVRFRLQVSSDV
jgi:hypothetical protein